MLRSIFALTATAAIAACAVTPTVPQSASLTRDTVRIDFGNGYICTGSKAEALQTDAGWQGQLQGCPQSYDYQVILLPGTNPVRYILVEGAKALGNENLFAPLAQVQVTQPNGRVIEFVSPPDRPQDDE